MGYCNNLCYLLFGGVMDLNEELSADVKEYIDFIENQTGETVKAGMMQSIMITMRAFGRLQTFCKKCGREETFKILDFNGTHSYLCKCGFSLYKFHKPDEFHKKAYFLKVFIPASKYDPNHKHKSELEKIGFKRKEVNGKTVFER